VVDTEYLYCSTRGYFEESIIPLCYQIKIKNDLFQCKFLMSHLNFCMISLMLTGKSEKYVSFSFMSRSPKRSKGDISNADFNFRIWIAWCVCYKSKHCTSIISPSVPLKCFKKTQGRRQCF